LAGLSVLHAPEPITPRQPNPRAHDAATGRADRWPKVDSMKNLSQRAFRMKIRKLRKETQAANESVALFLGPKLLGELRILMRLASNGRTANGLAKDTPLKSY